MSATRTFVCLSMWVLIAPLSDSWLLGQGPLASPVDGEPFAAQLHSISSDWKIHLRQTTGQRVMASAGLIRWGTPRVPRNYPHILLADGGVLIAQVVQFTGDHLVVSSDLWSWRKRSRPPITAVSL